MPLTEWENQGMCDDYYVKIHRLCGTEILVLRGFVAVCPKCQPERWAEDKAAEAKRLGPHNG